MPDDPSELNQLLKRLPKVDTALERPDLKPLLQTAPRWAVVAAIRGEIDKLRQRLKAGHLAELDAAEVRRGLEEILRPSLVRVINATGVVLHTNLGRAPLAKHALDRVVETNRGYCNVEYELEARKRGSRHTHVADLLCELTGAEDALVVNNCAAAVLLALAAHAVGKSVVVSRGELVEIGGSFRVPDVMRTSGARLTEVGTTNRTHLRDYENAISDEVAILLKVHRSNFALVGFTTEVSLPDLVELAHAKQKIAMLDLGSGKLNASSVSHDMDVVQAVQSGVDLLCFSGDKLLGGPQAGVILGSHKAIAACKSHPLLRALRPAKLTLSALEATLELYRDGRQSEIPAQRMLSASDEELRQRAEALLAICIEANPDVRFELSHVRSAVGGGASPLEEPSSWAVVASHEQHSPEELDVRLRLADPPVVGRIGEGKLILDVRTIAPDELAWVARAFGSTDTHPVQPKDGGKEAC